MVQGQQICLSRLNAQSRRPRRKYLESEFHLLHRNQSLQMIQLIHRHHQPSSVMLKWEKPAYDGGLEITHYSVYISKPEDPESFSKCGNAKATAFNVTALMSGREYNFRVTVVNANGESEPATIDEAVVPEDILESPQIELDASCQRTLVARAGGALRIYAKISARPVPVVVWSKLNAEIALNRAEIKQSDWEASLVITDCNRNDTG